MCGCDGTTPCGYHLDRALNAILDTRTTGLEAPHHRDNIPWYDAPIPRRWHKCAPWTSGVTRNLNTVDRCACGAIRLGAGRPWMERNSRRQENRRA